MRHRKSFNHLSRKKGHRKAMLSNMAASLIMHKKITTTTAKAKALRMFVEPLITKSKDDSTHSRRIAFSYLQDKDAVTELFREISPKIAERPGGYTRILKIGNRLGDNADMCVIELVDYNENLLTAKAEAEGKTTRRRRRGLKKKGAEPGHADKTAQAGAVDAQEPAETAVPASDVTEVAAEEGAEELQPEAAAEADVKEAQPETEVKEVSEELQPEAEVKEVSEEVQPEKEMKDAEAETQQETAPEEKTPEVSEATPAEVTDEEVAEDMQPEVTAEADVKEAQPETEVKEVAAEADVKEAQPEVELKEVAEEVQPETEVKDAETDSDKKKEEEDNNGTGNEKKE